MRRSSCLRKGLPHLAPTAFVTNPTPSWVVGQSWTVSREKKRGSAPFDGIGHLRLKRIGPQIEFGGDSGETDLAVNTGRVLKIGWNILTHGVASKRGEQRYSLAPPKERRRRCGSLGFYACAQATRSRCVGLHTWPKVPSAAPGIAAQGCGTVASLSSSNRPPALARRVCSGNRYRSVVVKLLPDYPMGHPHETPARERSAQMPPIAFLRSPESAPSVLSSRSPPRQRRQAVFAPSGLTSEPIGEPSARSRRPERVSSWQPTLRTR
jgi:hypothetical protein